MELPQLWSVCEPLSRKSEGKHESHGLTGNEKEGTFMQLEVLSDAQSVAARAAAIIAENARAACQARGLFLMAVSGGHTPWVMLSMLANEEFPWPAVHIFQVDERIAPAGDADRNLTHLRKSLLDNAPLDPAHIYPMPVESNNPAGAAAEYELTLQKLAGSPPVLDLVHLGLGPEGHTASLVPGDPVLQVVDSDIAVTGLYQGRKRMTLTYPVINRARQILWVMTGAEKVKPLEQLLKGDNSIPGGRIRRDNVLILADEAAIGPNNRKEIK
jgi:6-phosphogluconolactonase